MSKSVDAKDKSLREVLSNVQYAVDFYQREYKWGTKQVDELVSDLTTRFLESFDESHVRGDVATYPTYFLGSIVLSKKADGTFIVDGQQRLTSITLLLIYLRNLQRANGLDEDPDLRPMIQSTQYGKTSFNMNVTDRERVIRSLYEAAESVQLSEDDDISSVNIVDRYRDIEATFPEECKGARLSFFLDWLIERVQFVEIAAYSDEDAYLIFETMNDRGLSLSPAEMLKGYLLSNIRDLKDRHKAEKVWDSWVPRVQSLPYKDATNDFFRTWFRGRFANTYGPSSADYERLGPEFHRWLRDNAQQVGLNHSKDFAEFTSNQIPVYGHAFRFVRTNQTQYKSENSAVYYAGEHRLDDGLLLLAPVSVSDSNEDAEAKIRVVARFLDVWAYRRLWASRNLTKPALKATFIALAREVRDLSLEDLTARLYAELTKPGVDNFDTAPPSLSGSTRRKVHRLLARLTSFVEIHAGSGTDPYAELVVVSGRSRFDIEHIWPNRYPDYADLFETPAEFADYRNRLGSLLLIPHSFNTSYNAMTVEAKLPLYGRSDHHLLVASLAKATYERNPSFRNWTNLTGLDFKAYEGEPFTKQSSSERTDLYRSLAQSIWAPERVIEDSTLDPEVIFEQADEIRDGLEPEETSGRKQRRRADLRVTMTDLIEAGLISEGDTLVGRRPGVDKSATAIVLSNGSIQLESGERFTALSSAAMSLGLGVVINGWTFWVHESSGQTMAELRRGLTSD